MNQTTIDTNSAIYQGVKEVLADALAVDEDEIRPETGLISDLGMESIDGLDIVFKLEQKFGMRIEQGENPFSSETEPIPYPHPGHYNDRIMADIRKTFFYKQMDEDSRAQFERTRSSVEYGRSWTVASITRFVESKLRK